MATKDNSKYITYTFYRNNSKVPPLESFSFGSYPLVRNRTGYPLPGWRRIIAREGNATTYMSAVDNSVKLTPASAFCTVKNGYYNTTTGKFEDLDEWVSGYFLTPSNLVLNSFSTAKADNQALTRLYSAIRQLRTHVSGGTMVGELRESIGTIRNVTRKLAERIPRHLSVMQERLKKHPPPRNLGRWVFGPNGSAVRVPDTRGHIWPNGQVKKRISEVLADGWLEFSFGVRPLVKDVHDAAEALARYSERNAHQIARGYGTELLKLSDQTLLSPVNGMHIYSNIRTYTYSKNTVVYRAKFSLGQWFDGPYARMKTWTEIFGFTAEEFVPTVWNLLPYSFLFEYFINVGDLLSAMTTDTSGLLWASKTVIRETTREQTGDAVKHQYAGQDVSVAGTVGGCEHTTRTIVREPVTQLQWPSLELNLPTSANQAGNIVALLTGGNRYPRGY